MISSRFASNQQEVALMDALVHNNAAAQMLTELAERCVQISKSSSVGSALLFIEVKNCLDVIIEVTKHTHEKITEVIV